jgi:hypothetical protein
VTLGGVWEHWRDLLSGEVLKSCASRVTDANELIMPIHDRMPVILEPEDLGRWLATGVGAFPGHRRRLDRFLLVSDFSESKGVNRPSTPFRWKRIVQRAGKGLIERGIPEWHSSLESLLTSSIPAYGTERALGSACSLAI